MSIHRWWLALIATLLTPWVGPHVDRYLPIGWVLIQADAEASDRGFWLIAGVLLALCYAAWLVLLSGFAWLLHRRRNRESFMKAIGYIVLGAAASVSFVFVQALRPAGPEAAMFFSAWLLLPYLVLALILMFSMKQRASATACVVVTVLVAGGGLGCGHDVPPGPDTKKKGLLGSLRR